MLTTVLICGHLVSGMYGYRDHVGIRLADYQHGPDCVYLEQVYVISQHRLGKILLALFSHYDHVEG
jgi:hypothetical protein